MPEETPSPQGIPLGITLVPKCPVNFDFQIGENRMI
jgi:hypothetical protein